MKKSDLPPGTKVMASIDNHEYGDHKIIAFVFDGDEYDGAYTLTGVVLDKPAKEGHVFVSWDENYYDYTVEEVDIKLLSLESDLSNMEAEFKSYQTQIKAKIKEAVALIDEAGKLADKAHARSLESLYDITRPLINAMDRNGWRSSSWGC